MPLAEPSRDRAIECPAGPRTLVLGGARSGKSGYAERLLAAEPDVVYAATAPDYPEDHEWADRIDRHRRRRPATWMTVEFGERPEELAEFLLATGSPVLIDCLTLWLTAVMDRANAWDEAVWRTGTAQRRLAEQVDTLVGAFRGAPRRIVAVTNEVGFSVVPESRGTRRFRDELGRLNQAVAAEADTVWLIVAGLPLSLKPA